jgi:hypothetical protein
MPNEASFVEENAKSQRELRDLVARLSDSDLARPVSAEWTVAVLLAHLAFYDFRAAAVVDRWLSEGEIDPFPLDAQLTNAVTEPLLQAIPPRSAAQLALRAAEAVDGRMAALAAKADLVARIEGSERSVSLFRSEHRREHLEQIGAALGQ